MKNILMDICLVLLILVIGSQIMDPYVRAQQEIKTQLEAFNEDVTEKEVISTPYRLTKDPQQNKVSDMVEEVSDISREGIKLFVEFFSKTFIGF